MGLRDIGDARDDLGMRASWNQMALAELLIERAGLPPQTRPFCPAGRTHSLAGLFSDTFVASRPISATLRYTPGLAGVVRGAALLAEMGDRLLEGGRAYAKDTGVGKSEFEDKKKGESNAGRPGRHRGHDERIRFRKDSESEKQRDRPKDQNDDQTRTDRAARDLKGHQEPRSCDLIGEGAHGRESLLLLLRTSA